MRDKNYSLLEIKVGYKWLLDALKELEIYDGNTPNSLFFPFYGELFL